MEVWHCSTVLVLTVIIEHHHQCALRRVQIASGQTDVTSNPGYCQLSSSFGMSFIHAPAAIVLAAGERGQT